MVLSITIYPPPAAGVKIQVNIPRCPRITIKIKVAASNTVLIGPIFTPMLESSKKRI